MTVTYTLSYGAHPSPEEGVCLLEAVALLAGEAHSDAPECCCPVLATFGRRLNDAMGRNEEGNALRNKFLADLAPRLVGTRSSPKVAQRRAFVLVDAAARVFAPIALGRVGRNVDAAKLRALPEIVGKQTAINAAATTVYAADAVDAMDAVESAACGIMTRAAHSAAYATCRAECWPEARAAFIRAIEVTA